MGGVKPDQSLMPWQESYRLLAWSVMAMPFFIHLSTSNPYSSKLLIMQQL
jgi:hypothetical protein